MTLQQRLSSQCWKQRERRYLNAEKEQEYSWSKQTMHESYNNFSENNDYIKKINTAQKTKNSFQLSLCLPQTSRKHAFTIKVQFTRHLNLGNFQWMLWPCLRILRGNQFQSSFMLGILGKNFSRQHTETFFLFFPEKRIWHFMQNVSSGDNLHKMSNLFSRKYMKIISKCHLPKILPGMLSV